MQMRNLHIANTFFEEELSGKLTGSLSQAFYKHPIYLQLQFLPILYAEPDDWLFASDPPPEECALHLFSEKNCQGRFKIESWGASRLIKAWAKKHGHLYDIPDWDVVKKVNSKLFSFTHSVPLDGAKILYDETQTRKWMQNVKQDKVLKTVFGVSGRGHMHIKNNDFAWEAVLRVLRREWEAGYPVIAEPWVDRVLDFSTQWLIEKSGALYYYGATLCHNDERGQYAKSEIGVDVPFLQEHIEHAIPVLEEMGACGYFGNVGCDAMVYRTKDEDKVLHPIVEINARKTMGWAALIHQQKHYPDQRIVWSFLPGKKGILPTSLLLSNGKQVNFSRNLDLAHAKPLFACK